MISVSECCDSRQQDVSGLRQTIRSTSGVLSSVFIAVSMMFLIAETPALAGAPFVTDDPEPPEYGHWEVSAALQGAVAKHSHSASLPSAEANYGLIPDVELHVAGTMSYHREDGAGYHYGVGDSELGVKYRFIEEVEDGWRPQAAIVPTVSLGTGDDKKGLGAGHQKVFLPVWLQKSFGEWTTYGGGGYYFNQHEDDRDYWYIGWVLTKKVTDSLCLGGELYRQSSDTIGGKNMTGMTLGGVYEFDEENRLRFSAGRGIGNVDANQLSYYLGYQRVF